MTTSQEAILVPNVEGVTVAIASQTLLDAGLMPRYSSAVQSSALVIRQDPRPGASLMSGGEVVLSTSLAEETSRTLSELQSPVYAISAAPSEVTVIPQRMYVQSAPVTQTVPGQGQLLALPDGQGTVYYEPPQPRLSPYFVQNTTPRVYPAWYPRQLLPQSTFQQQSVAVQATQASSGVQGTPWTYQITVAPGDSSFSQARYPKVGGAQDGYTIKGYGGTTQASSPQVGLLATSSNPAIAVPNVLYLSLSDAIAALNLAGLLAGNPTYIDSPQGRSGVVVNQVPPARTLAPAGTVIQLWIAR